MKRQTLGQTEEKPLDDNPKESIRPGQTKVT
jgi:hypothetical protein